MKDSATWDLSPFTVAIRLNKLTDFAGTVSTYWILKEIVQIITIALEQVKYLLPFV
jgi:hypothetical protein